VLKKDLTGSALLEMDGFRVNQALGNSSGLLVRRRFIDL
jgi:hypothetical protein